jgi:hypothetical protein
MKKQTKTTTSTTSTSAKTTSKKSSTSKMSNQEVLSFYRSRSRRGDNQLISSITGYSKTHISNIKNGNRTINDSVAKAMYKVSSKRKATV